MKKTSYPAAVALAALLCMPGAVGRQPGRLIQPRLPGSPEAAPSKPPAGFGTVPLQFIPNEGQVDGPAAFYVQGKDKAISFAPEGLTFVLKKAGGPGARGDQAARWVVKLDFVGSRRDVRPVGLETSGAVISYFKGRPGDWRTGLRACSKIAYRELWPGIDLVYSGTQDRMKYEFVVRPGADPSRIRLAYRGANRVAATSQGRISVETPAGGFEDDVPVAYQEIGGGKVAVPVAYALEENGAVRQDRGRPAGYGFRVGAYDRSRTLVIDPDLLVYCGFVGGAGAESVCGIQVTYQGVVIAGTTSSTEWTFPVAAGPDPAYNGGDTDVFVAKLNESGTALESCFYIGGGGRDVAAGVVSAWPSVFVTGSTTSTEATFPVTEGPDLTYNGGETDAFIACADLLESKLVFCGYIGGSGRDEAAAIALQTSLYEGDPGALCVAGWTSSTEATFPVKIGPDLTYNGGDSDAFVAELNPNGKRFYYCGYIGGAGGDEITAVTYPPPVINYWSGAIYFLGHPCVAGWTSSAESSFPVAGGPDLTYNGGDSDAFYARLEQYGRFLDFCGYIGGDGSDRAAGVYCDSIYDNIDPGDFMSIITIAGTTSSTESTFPVTYGPDLTYNGGDSDAFVFKVGGLTPSYCGYIGGAGSDVATGLGHGYDDAFCRVVGYTSSTEATFPVLSGPDLTYNGGAFDAFIAEINDSDSQLRRCSYIGGAGADRALGLSITWGAGLDRGEAYVAGVTDSTETTFPVVGGPDLTYNGGESDGFVARIAKVWPALASLSPPYAPLGSPGFTLVITGSGFLEGAQVSWGDRAVPTAFVSDTELHAAIEAADLAVGRAVNVSVTNPDGFASGYLVFEVRNPVPALTAISPVRATGGGGDLKLVAQGAGFMPNASVLWNGASRWTTYVSDMELQADISASDLVAGGEYQVTVSNPAPNEGASNAIVFPVSSFALTPSPPTATVTAGQSATYTIQLTPLWGTFDASVSFACADLPDKCTASFSPASVTPGEAAAAATLTLTTTASTAPYAGTMNVSPGPPPSVSGSLAVLLTALLALCLIGGIRCPRRRAWAPAALLVCLLILMSGCATEIPEQKEHTYNGTPRGTHTISVSGISGGLTVSTVVQLTVQ